MSMSDADPMKIEEIRRFSAIYGRFDCKRKPEKPLTMHEVSVNEAAAQLCLLMPTLLTRRDELFPLARQVVRNSGYQYSKGHSRSQFSQSGFPSKLFGTNVNIHAAGGGGGGSGNGGGSNGSSLKSDDGRDPPSDEANGRDFSSERTKPPRKRPRYQEPTEEVQQRRRVREPRPMSGRTSSNERPLDLIRMLAFQERVEEITEELRTLLKRMEDLRGAAARAGSANDGHALHSISQQLELITAKHNQLFQEQRDLTTALQSRLTLFYFILFYFILFHFCNLKRNVEFLMNITKNSNFFSANFKAFFFFF